MTNTIPAQMEKPELLIMGTLTYYGLKRVRERVLELRKEIAAIPAFIPHLYVTAAVELAVLCAPFVFEPTFSEKFIPGETDTIGTAALVGQFLSLSDNFRSSNGIALLDKPDPNPKRNAPVPV